MIYAPDKNAQEFLNKFGIVFDEDIYAEKRIVLRKEIKRYLRETLKSNN